MHVLYPKSIDVDIVSIMIENCHEIWIMRKVGHPSKNDSTSWLYYLCACRLTLNIIWWKYSPSGF